MSDKHLDNWLLTDQQRKGVVHTGEKVVMTAGAGTGKTRVLTHRFAHLVLSGQAGIESILAITFTEKAAGEMAQRVAQIFEEAGRIDLRRKLTDASISTIHAFCARLLREKAIEAGIDPTHSILTDFEKDRIIDSALSAALSRLQETQKDDYTELVTKIRTEGRFGPDITGAISRIYEQLRTGRTTLHNAFEIQDPTQRTTELIEILNELIPQYLSLDEAKPKSTKTMQHNREAVTEILKALEIPEPENMIPPLRDNKIKLSVAKDLKPIASGIRDAALELAYLAAERYAIKVRLLLKQIVKAFDEEYKDVKKKKSLLDFSDLERRAIELLSDRADIRNSIRDRYRFVLIDEYQDTNPMQAKLVELITEKDRLFIVGDHKQSIYRFRQADVRVFQKEVVADDGLRISLDKNFRSKKSILDFVNIYFQKMWVDLPDELKYAPISVGLESQKSVDKAPAIEIIASMASQDQDLREAEAATLIRKIKGMIAGNDAEPVIPGDIVVLFRSKTRIAAFVAELIRNQIAFNEVKGRGFFTRAEVVDLQNYLAAMADPYDEIALACILRSPFAGLSDAALFHLCTNAENYSGGLIDACENHKDISGLGEHDRAALDRFLSVYNELCYDCPALGIDETVQAIFEKTGYLTWSLTQPDASRRAGNIALCIRNALEYSRDYGPTPAGLADALRDLRLLGIQSQDSPGGSAEESLTLMTVHAAKGLESPVVVIADCNHGASSDTSPILYHPDHGVGFKVYLPDFSQMNTLTLEKVKKQNKEDASQEDLRLFYVAMTRAERRLIFSFGLKENAGGTVRKTGWCKSILSFLKLNNLPYDQWPEIVTVKSLDGIDSVTVAVTRDDQVPETTVPATPVPEFDLDALLAKADSLPDAVKVPGVSRYLYSISEVVSFARCRRKFYLLHRLGLPLDYLPDIVPDHSNRDEKQAEAVSGALFGTAVHEILAGPTPDNENWQTNAMAIAKALGLDEGAASSALSAVKKFYRNPQTGKMLSKGTAYRELPLLWKYNNSLLRGKIDLFIDSGDGGILMDYKTNRISKGSVSNLADQYRLQMNLYAMALEAYTGKRVDRAVLYSTSADCFVDVRIDDKAVKEAESIIDALIKADENSDFPAEDHLCPDCKDRVWCLGK